MSSEFARLDNLTVLRYSHNNYSPSQLRPRVVLYAQYVFAKCVDEFDAPDECCTKVQPADTRDIYGDGY